MESIPNRSSTTDPITISSYLLHCGQAHLYFFLLNDLQIVLQFIGICFAIHSNFIGSYSLTQFQLAPHKCAMFFSNLYHNVLLHCNCRTAVFTSNGCVNQGKLNVGRGTRSRQHSHGQERRRAFVDSESVHQCVSGI